jgi:biopolymer transport protein ExbD
MNTGENEGDAGGSHAAATYRGMRSRRSSGTLSDINVTPLVDVVLVLLLIFMVTAPMMSRGIDVSLPVADQPEEQQEDRITVTINAEGRVYISEQPILLQLLEEELRNRMMSLQKKIAYLRADESLQYGRVIEVVDKMKKAGVEQIGFVYILPEEKTSS